MYPAFYRLVAALVACLALTGCPGPTTTTQTPVACENLDEAVEDLDLDGSIADFEVPLVWDAHRSDCVEQYRVLRGTGPIQTDEIEDSDTEELYTTHDTDFLDTITGPGTYSYFIVALTADNITTPTSEELTVVIEADGSGRILKSDSGSNRYEQALYGTYAYAYYSDEPYYNTEEEIWTFYEDADGTSMLSMHVGLAGLDTAYYPAGRCLDTFSGYLDLPYSAGPNTLTLQFDGESFELEYSLIDGELEVDGGGLFQTLTSGVEDMTGCFSMAFDVELDYPSDTTAHFTVIADTSLDVVPGNTDSLDSIVLDYGDGDTDTLSTSGGSYDFYHDINPVDMPVFYTAIASTAGGIYLHAYGEYTAICANHDDYEPNDTANAATTLAVDGVPLDLTFTDAKDWFAADLSAGVHYRFRANPIDVDSEMYLYDTDGSTELDYADETYGSAAAIDFIPDADGIYFVQVRPFYGPQCEDYTLVLTTP